MDRTGDLRIDVNWTVNFISACKVRLRNRQIPAVESGVPLALDLKADSKPSSRKMAGIGCGAYMSKDGIMLAAEFLPGK
jgi:hypothetical protein